MSDKTQSGVTQDEVVQTAIMMEELGRDFYEALGGASRNPKVLQLCHRLAADEDKHREVFRQLHHELASHEESVFVDEQQAAVARRRIKANILPTSDVIRQVACGGNLASALDMAVKMEGEAIRFFSQLARCLPPGSAVETIVAEERQHLRMLTALRCGIEAGG